MSISHQNKEKKHPRVTLNSEFKFKVKARKENNTRKGKKRDKNTGETSNRIYSDLC